MKVITQDRIARHYTGLDTKKYKLRSKKVQDRLNQFAIEFGKGRDIQARWKMGIWSVAMRGALTNHIQELSKKHIGRVITTRELRLIPYLVDTMLNTRKLNMNKISSDELDILEQLTEEGYLQLREDRLYMRRSYYEYCTEVLWFAYANHDNTNTLINYE